MSNYLLLRNNKESGPYTLEEIKGMALKAYDLLWVEGKSAAWRYPGEISELKAFAPAIPEQFYDTLFKKPNSDQAAPDTVSTKKSEPSITRSRENNSRRLTPVRSVYVNLPAEKKLAVIQPDRVFFDIDYSSVNKREPAYDFSDLYKKQPAPIVSYSGKVIWVGTILLLFGTGILTGFFISDRRKFFTEVANHPQNLPAVLNHEKEISSSLHPASGNSSINETVTSIKINSVKPLGPASKKMIGNGRKKDLKTIASKKDSAVLQTAAYSSLQFNDSLMQNPAGKTETILQKIKAHPENYLNLVAGRYSTGLFGGISSFPVSVTNNSPVKLDLVEINIEYIQNNEKIFKTESLSFDDLEPGETVTLKAPKSPRGIKISARIHLVNAHQPDPGYSN
jgi:hypothetical protein